jgi:hypothetical protein
MGLFITGDPTALNGFEVIVIFWFSGFVIKHLFKMVMIAGSEGRTF